jgi:hypothetical protein
MTRNNRSVGAQSFLKALEVAGGALELARQEPGRLSTGCLPVSINNK